MKKFGFTSVLMFVLTSAFSQRLMGEVDSALLPVLRMHYEAEYAFDRSTNPSAWTSQQGGLHASFGSTERAFFRTEVPLQTESQVWEATGWKGERLNTQVLVWSADTLEQVRFTPGNLTSENGKTISSKNYKMDMVRYVLGNYPYGAKDAVCGNTPYASAFLMPDRFETLDQFDVPGKTIRPVWISLNVPAGTEAGVYTGTIRVTTSTTSKTLTVKLRIQNLALPAPKDWSYRLDLWQNPWVIAWRNHIAPWSEEHKLLLKKHLKLYADAGGKYITTYAVHSPWADNSYMIEGGMIDWIKTKNGSWRFDYSIFDTYVELAMQAGVDKAITIYSPVPWGDRFRVKDEVSGNYAYETWTIGSKIYAERWNTFLTDLKKHLMQKRWFQKTFIGINESEMKQTLAAIKVVKGNSKDWKITYAGNWHKELDSVLDDFSFLYGNEPKAEELQARKAHGGLSTFYVCCNPAKPNNFVFSPPVEGRWISWYAAAFGYDGFLRWAYEAWPEDPVRDARFGSWPAGDTYLVYPGANSSVRFEKLREGIADFEKIRILKQLALKSNDKKVQELWKNFEQHMQSFISEHDFNEEKIIADVTRGRELVDELSERLTGKHTF